MKLGNIDKKIANEEMRGRRTMRTTATAVLLLALSAMLLPGINAEATDSSGSLTQDDSWSFTFNEEGLVTFWCSPHPTMTGDIQVVPVGTEGALSGQVFIEIIDYSFSPSNLTVEVGSTITWTNKDDVTHTVEIDLQGGAAPEGEMMMQHGSSMSWTMFWDMAGWKGVLGLTVVFGGLIFLIAALVKSRRGGCNSSKLDVQLEE
jgi:plastocyanin